MPSDTEIDQRLKRNPLDSGESIIGSLFRNNRHRDRAPKTIAQ